jgi:hypothetical protein
MEESLNITIHDIEPRVKEFIEMPAGPLKNVQYYENIQSVPIRRTSLLKREGNLYFSSTGYTVKRNMQSYYLRPKDKVGFTLNEKGKLSIWFGKSVQELYVYMPLIFEALHIDFIKQLPDNYTHFITKTVLEKMLNGKITNPIDFCSQVIKNWRVKGASPRVLYNTMMFPSKNGKMSFAHRSFTKGISVCKNFDHYMDYLVRSSNTNSRFNIEDLEMQATILDRKIDYNWSEKRLEEEHNTWTKEIMVLKKDNLSNEPIDKLQWFRDHHHLLNDHFTLLDNEIDIFEEGHNMSHCLYTNYLNYVKRGSYVAYHVTYKGEEVTFGMFISSDKLNIDQMQCKGNSRASFTMQDFIADSITELSKTYSSEKPLLKSCEMEELPF